MVGYTVALLSETIFYLLQTLLMVAMATIEDRGSGGLHSRFIV